MIPTGMGFLQGARAGATLLALSLLGCGGSSTIAPDPATDGSTDPDSQTPDSTGDDTSPLPDTGTTETAPPPAANYTVAGTHATSKKDTTVSGQSVHCLFPSDAPPAAGFPGVAFAHGFQLSNGNYDQILTHIASWGYVVCSTNFPGSLLSQDHNDVATALTSTRIAMAAGTLAGLPKVDAGHIAAAGHSLGGKGATMAVLADPAFVAALTFDPVDGNPGNPLGGGPDAQHPQLAPTQTAKLKVPMGYFGATQSHCSSGGIGSSPCAPTGLDAAALYAGTATTVPRYLWTVWDFGHMQFLDDPNCGFTCNACVAGTSSTVAARKVAIKATAVAFLERHLRGDLSAQSYLDGAKRAANVAAKNFWDGTSAAPSCN